MSKTRRPLSLLLVSGGLAFLGVGALYGGGGLVLAPDGHLIGLPAGGLRGPLFADYLIPGMILFSLFGVGSLLTLYALWARPWPELRFPLPLLREEHWAWGAAFGLGAAQVIWILAQLALTSFRAPLQLLCGGAGLLVALGVLDPALRRAYRREEWAGGQGV